MKSFRAVLFYGCFDSKLKCTFISRDFYYCFMEDGSFIASDFTDFFLGGWLKGTVGSVLNGGFWREGSRD